MGGVEIQKLSKVFNGPKGTATVALKGLELSIRAGELLVMVGPSGSGKTTLLRLIAGLEQPSDGSIWLDGRVVNALPPEAREVAMVFQEPALYPHMSVAENLGFGLRLRKVPGAEIRSRLAEVAKLLGLGALLDRAPNALSGGERQRVALGRAIVLRPKLLLLDEPLSNLDAPLRAQMRREIFKLQRSLSATMLYVTHDQAEAMALGDRIAVLEKGVLQQIDTPQQVYRNPANLFVGSFLGSPAMNLVPGKLALNGSGNLWFETDLVQFPLERFKALKTPATAHERVLWGIRAEDLDISDSQEGALAENVGRIEAEVEAVEFLGTDTQIYVKAGSASLVVRSGPLRPVQVGQKVQIAFRMGDGYYFDARTGERLL
jgi:multiple sugar transport system ATP-binding protein